MCRKKIIGIVLFLFLFPGFSKGFLIDTSVTYILYMINKYYDYFEELSFNQIGSWHLAKAKAQLKPPEQLEKLAAIPYLSGYKIAPRIHGVTVYERKLAYNGLNLYTSGHASVAYLMDMRGKILHKWSYDFKQVWPDYVPSDSNKRHTHFWSRVHLFDNGDLIAIFERIGIIKIDKDSNLIWAYQNGCHHDIYVTQDNNIYVLTFKKRIIPRLNRNVSIEEDFVTILDQNGNEIKSISLLEIVKKSPIASLIPLVYERNQVESIDIFHTNTLEVFDGRLSKKLNIFKKGNILVSFLYLNTVAIIDLNTEEVVWVYGSDNLFHQHKPTLLENGNIMIFDNGYNRSRVIEIEPVSKKIIWEYDGDSKNEFF